MFKSWIYWILSALVLIAIFFTLDLVFQKDDVVSDDALSSTTSDKVAPEEYFTVAFQIANEITEISPTPPFGENGWIAKRISFVPESNLAYIEYTDTHVALRLLLEYYYQSEKLSQTKVLATFKPDEQGLWMLDHGQDSVQSQGLLNFVLDGDSNQWIPEVTFDT